MDGSSGIEKVVDRNFSYIFEELETLTMESIFEFLL